MCSKCVHFQLQCRRQSTRGAATRRSSSIQIRRGRAMASRARPRRVGAKTQVARRVDSNRSDEADKLLSLANKTYQGLMSKRKKVPPERVAELQRFVHTF